MAGLTAGGPNVDVSLLYQINGLAQETPGWFDRIIGFTGEYGLLLVLVLLVLWCWRGIRKLSTPAAAEGFAALVWTPLAAGIALLLNIPLRQFVGRPRPFRQYGEVEVLTQGTTDFSFVSDHATLAMALGVGLFIAHRKLGFIGIGIALLEGFCRVYMGVHYPTDVVGGLALGTAVVLLLAPLAMALLTPLARAIAMSPRVGWLVRARGCEPAQAVDLPRASSRESDLAA
ncbi:phosphatase PAP2 family protein [Streptomyces sp. NPDC002054]|uniref:phosphatase PAP2 family protein n=1 Tax=Streptomyces sp. NPDC002054 TaxID=3154663 RepID=UPI00331B391D